MNRVIAVLLALLAMACTSKKTNFQLSGSIVNPSGNIVYLVYNKQIDTLKLDSAGKFNWDKDLSKLTYLELVHGEAIYQIFAAPNNELQMSFDYKQADVLPEFTGTLATENEYLSERTALDEELFELENELYTSEENEFIALNDSLSLIRNNVLDEAKPDFATKTAKEFAKLEASLIEVKWLNKYLEYELYYPYLKTNPTYFPSEAFFAYKKKINPNKPELLVLADYVDLLENFVEVKKKETNALDAIADNNEQKVKRHFSVIETNVSNKEVKDVLKYRAVEKYLNNLGTDGLETFFADFIKTITDEQIKNRLTKLYQSWELVKKGNDAPEISGVDIEGNPVSLSQLKGKLVYLDIWATWCGPCRQEFPALDSLITDLKNSEVEIVSLSIDDSQDPWYKMVKEQKLKGRQWFVKKDKLVAAYNIKSIPRYMIIDKAGKIVTANAERPSGNAKAQLQALLGKDKLS